MRAFPYKKTVLIGLFFLGSLLWANTFQDGVGLLVVGLSALCVLMSLVANTVLAVSQRSGAPIHRIAINLAVCLLAYPAIYLGASLRDRIFLKHLSRFQAATTLLVEDATPKFGTGVSEVEHRLPSGFADLGVADRVLIDSKQGAITVRYISRDSSALGHRGYLYRSDDNLAGLRRDFPRLEYSRVVRGWFTFSD